MCGITGAIWTDPNRAVDEDQLARMTEVLGHRGPDDTGSYRSEYQLRPPYEALPGVALGFRRLSIIDLSLSRQPIPNEDETIWVVFNGEIYNFPELRHRLEGGGHRLRTQGDGETIVHLYEDEGLDCFRHLNGMFAIAIWDQRQRRLVLARDRLGQKPLVYCRQPGRLLFASELKSLLQVGDVPRDVDPGAIDEYLTYQYVPYPNTIFQGISKLPPAHYAVFQDDHFEAHAYWNPDFNRQRPWTRAAASAALAETFRSSVKMRMRSDVPLGAFLSGGVDSSLVAAIMQQESQQQIKTFTIGFPVAEYDESDHAERVARHLGTEHHKLEVTPSGVDILPKLVWHFDEPFADSSAIPTWYLSEMTRQFVTVALSGDGGDELFAGYPRYKAVALAARLDRLGPLRGVLAARIWQSLPTPARQKSLLRRLQRFAEVLALPPGRRYLDWICIFNEARRGALYREEFLAQLPGADPYQFLGRALQRSAHRDEVAQISLADLVTYLPGDLMTKVDIASMAHSLEVRQPFLDYRLVELAAGIPSRYKLSRGRGKRILHATFRDLLPADIWRRSKMGFGVPLDHWFRDELRELTHDTLLGDSARCHEYFRPEVIRQFVEQHEHRQFDHSYRLWALLVLELWLREWTAPPVCR